MSKSTSVLFQLKPYRPVVLAVCGLFLLLAGGLIPLAYALSPAVATELAAMRDPGGPALAVCFDTPGHLDPWGSAWRYDGEARTERKNPDGSLQGVTIHADYDKIYSPGPNRIDEGGAGDDVFLGSNKLLCYLLIRSPVIMLLLAVTVFWLAHSSLARAPRSPKPARELLRVLGLAAFPAILGCTAGFLFTDLTVTGGLHTKMLVSLQVAASGTFVLVCLLLATWLRMRRPLELQEPLQAATRGSSS